MKKGLLYLLAFLIGAGVLYLLYIFKYDDHTESQKNKVITAFGDSLTYGKGARSEQGYIGQLEKQLNQRKNHTYQIHNYGIPGQQSEGVLKQLGNIKISEKINESDYIILYIGTNDFRYSSGGNFLTLNKEKLNQQKADYINNIHTIVKAIRSLNKEVPIIVLGLYNPFPDKNEIDAYINDWNTNLKREIIQTNHVQFIPTNDLFQHEDKKQYFSDALHLNHEGYKKIADRLVLEIK